MNGTTRKGGSAPPCLSRLNGIGGELHEMGLGDGK
jgi:hypothetical protein